MELKDITGTFQQAKRFAEMGVVQTFFHHWLTGNPAVVCADGVVWMISRTACFAPAPFDWGQTYSAYTLRELGVMWALLEKSPEFDNVGEDLANEWAARAGLSTPSDLSFIQTLYNPEYVSEFVLRLLERAPKRMVTEINNKLLSKHGA